MAPCVHKVPLVERLDDVGIFAAHRAVKQPHSLRLLDKAARLGQNGYHLVTAVCQCALHGDSIGNAAVIIQAAVDFYRLAGGRQGAGCHNAAVIILMQGAFREIDRRAGGGIGDDHPILGGVCHQGRKIQRILAGAVGQIGIDIMQPEQVPGFQIAFQPEIRRVVRPVGVKTQIASALPRQIGGSIGGTCRHGNGVIKGDMRIQKGVQNARAVRALHTAALYDQTDFCHTNLPLHPVYPGTNLL